MLGYDVCVLSGSVGKVANLAVPDLVLSNMSDVVDHCRRITRIADVSLMVDAEDGFGKAVNVMRTVKELEAAGVSAIEIEDNIVPKQFHVSHPGLVSKAEQVGKLKAAVAARTDPTTVVVARTSALAECSLDEALDRIRAYADTGAEALMLIGVHRRRADLEAVHQATPLPLCVLNPPPDVGNDPRFLAANGVRILMNQQVEHARSQQWHPWLDRIEKSRDCSPQKAAGRARGTKQRMDASLDALRHVVRQETIRGYSRHR